MKTIPRLLVSSDRLVMQRQVLAFYLIILYDVWGPVTSFTFRNSRGVQHMLSGGGGGGGGGQTFFPRGWTIELVIFTGPLSPL